MINSIKLINWRSHSDSYLEFEKGTNLLLGQMGSGKSSVMDSISFALYGTFPSLESRKLSLLDLFRFDEEHAEVIIEIDWKGNKYRIHRKIEKKKNKINSDAYIYMNEKLVEKGSVAVSKYVEELLAVDYELFTRAIYSEQNSIDYFLTLNPKKRKDEMDVLLGLDRFEMARENVVSVNNRVKNKKKILEDGFNEERLCGEIRKREENKEKLRKMIYNAGEFEKELKSSDGEIEKGEKEILELKKLKERYFSLKEEDIKLKEMVSYLEKKLKERKIEDLDKLETENKECVEQIEKYKNETKEIEEKLIKITSQNSLLKRELEESGKSGKRKKELEKEVEGIGKIEGIGEKEKELLENKTELMKIKNEIEEIRELSKKLKHELKNCPLCDTELNKDGIEHIKKEKEKKLEENKKIIEKLEGKIGKRENEIGEIRKKSERKKEIEQEIGLINKKLKDEKELERNIEVKERELKELKPNKEKLNKENGELLKRSNEIKNKIKEMKETEENKKELEKKKRELEKINNELKEIKFNEKEYEEMRKEIEKIKIGYEKLKAKFKYNKEQMKELKEILEILEKSINEGEKVKEEIKRLGKLEEELSVYKNHLLEAQVELRSSMVDSINSAMNEIWHIFYPYGDYKALRLSVTEKDYSFEIYDGQWKRLESIASGGERACAALTLRVALATVLTPNLSWIILDEPTHNLDKEAVQLLSSTLQIKVPKIVDQTFIITHEEELMGANFSVSYRLKRDKELGESTKIEHV